MKHRVFLTLLLIFNVFLYSQDIERQKISDEHEFLWPVQGAYPGENIFMSPTDQIFNSYFKKWQPFMEYIIGGEVGDPVVAVEDGLIFHLSYNYSDDFLYSWSTDSIEEMTEFIGHRKHYDPKWVNIFIGLEIAPGKRVWYTGLSPDHLVGLKEGDRVKRGDVIGAIGYNYRFHEKPGLNISYDEKGRSADVEKKLLGTDNGLFSSRRSLIKSNFRTKVYDIEELHKSMEILYKTLKEIHPSLYRFVEEEEFERLYQTTLDSISRPLTSDNFFKMINPLIQSIRDNHTYLDRKYIMDDFYLYDPKPYLPVQLYIYNNRCYILDDPEANIDSGAEVVEINGEDIADIVKQIKRLTPIASGGIKTYQDEVLKYDFNHYYLLEKGLSPGEAVKLKTKDGEIYYSTITKKNDSNENSAAEDETYSFEHLSNDSVLFSVKQMRLTDVDIEDIRTYFFNHKLWKRNVILDLRGNPGGDIMDTYFLFSLFSKESFFPIKKQVVTSNSTYETLQYSTNYSNDFEMYKEYTNKETGGKFSISLENQPELFHRIEPEEKYFKGDLYILTDGFTGSAATELSALFKYHKIGEVIGSEGAGNFYSMNGIDFAKIMLGKTGIVLNIPMIHIENNYDVLNEIPLDRGVIPDYSIENSLDDILSGKDRVLEFATDRVSKKQFKKQIILISITILLFPSILIPTLYFNRRRNHREERTSA